MKWPTATPSDAWLMENGWKKKRTYSGSTRYIFISPCKQFVCKTGFFTTLRPRRYAIPSKFLGNYKTGYSFVLQPIADVSAKARRSAMKFLGSKRSLEDCDICSYNMGFYNGKPVLIDW